MTMQLQLSADTAASQAILARAQAAFAELTWLAEIGAIEAPLSINANAIADHAAKALRISAN
jgi:hypothetical protein